MLKAYKYRIYPNKQQAEQIQKTFGCCRFVYNQTLAYRKELYETKKESMSRIDCNNWKNRVLKVKYEWLQEVDKYALDNAVINMYFAYQKFLKNILDSLNLKVKEKTRNHIKQIIQIEILKFLLKIIKSNFQNLNGLEQKFIENL